MLCLVAQLCLTVCDPRDCSPQGSSVHGILQGRRLEWVPMPSSKGSSQLRIEPRSPASRADTLTSEPPGKPLLHKDRSKSLSSALIICRMTSLWIPQITVSNQIKSLIPRWKTELEGPREPRTLLPLPEDSSSDSRSRTHGGVREKMENDHCKGVNRLQRCRWQHPGSGNRCFRRW